MILKASQSHKHRCHRKDISPATMMKRATVFVTVKHGKQIHQIPLKEEEIHTSVLELKETLVGLTSARIENIKLIQNGRVLRDEEVVDAANDMTITMIAASSSSNPRRDPHSKRVINDLTTDGVQLETHPSQLTYNVHQQPRVRTAFEFERIEVLPGLPDQERAREILTSLANDPAILAVMQKHQWKVGVLAELYPEGLVGQDEVCILGLNTNRGQKIELRLRTDDLQGFRKIQTIKKTLYHELAHNVHGPHDSKFYTLLRQIEKEIVELDWRAGKGETMAGLSATAERKYASSTSSVSRVDGGYERDRTFYRLQDESIGSSGSSSGGGGGGGGNGGADDHLMTPHRLLPARVLAAQAAELRLTEVELENERGCGCTWLPPSETPLRQRGEADYGDNGSSKETPNSKPEVECKGGEDEDLCMECDDMIVRPPEHLSINSPHAVPQPGSVAVGGYSLRTHL